MFGLARELGMTVHELGIRMSSLELAEWREYMVLQNETVQGDELANSAAQGLQDRKNKLGR